MWQGMAITGRCAIDGIADCPGNVFSVAGDIGMSLFASFGNELSYEDVIQLDEAFAATHVNYGKAPLFNGAPHEDSSWESRKEFIFSSGLSIEETVERIRSVDGTATDFGVAERTALWRDYWLEYINIFNVLTGTHPDSVATVFVGRRAIEIGFKYLLFKNTYHFPKTHDLGVLSREFLSAYGVGGKYLEYVDDFCVLYCKYLEGGNPEYFRFPEYKSNNYFAGTCLDLKWLCHNFALILLKLIHFDHLDAVFK